MQQQHPANKHTRRQVGRLALGGFTAVALAACGGGGGDGSDTDNQRSLLDAFNKLEDGMGPEDVTALVGRPAEEIGGSGYSWRNTNSEYLNADFNQGSGTQLSGVQWGIGGTSNYRFRSFKEV